MAATVTTTSVKFTDPSLQNFHTQRKNAYEQTKNQIDRNFSGYQQDVEGLDTLVKKVRHDGSQLQNGKVEPIPSQEELEKQKTVFLNEYEKFKATYEKLKEFADNIKGTIDFLQPVVRSYTEEQSLKKSSPTLYEETKRSKEVCLDYVRKLTPSHQSVVSLQNRMCTTLTGNELSWSLQRFCAIVDNNGNPLSLCQRSLNYCTTPVVPETPVRRLDLNSLQDPDKSFIVIPPSPSHVSNPKPNDEHKPSADLSEQPENPIIPPAPPNSPSHISDSKPNEKSKTSADLSAQPENPSIIIPTALPNSPSNVFDSKPNEESKASANPPPSQQPENPSINPPTSPSNPPASIKPKVPVANASKPVVNGSTVAKAPAKPAPQNVVKKNV